MSETLTVNATYKLTRTGRRRARLRGEFRADLSGVPRERLLDAIFTRDLIVGRALAQATPAGFKTDRANFHVTENADPAAGRWDVFVEVGLIPLSWRDRLRLLKLRFLAAVGRYQEPAGLRLCREAMKDVETTRWDVTS